MPVPFLTLDWFGEAAEAFADLPVDEAAAVRIGFDVDDGGPATVSRFSLTVDLDSGGMRFEPGRAWGNPTLRLPYADAAAVLLGSAADRIGVFETGRLVLTGNLTQMFFLDRVFQQDTDGVLRSLRERTTGLPARLGAIGWAPNGPGGPPTRASRAVATPNGDAGAEWAAEEALPRTLAAVRGEIGHSTPGGQVYVSRGGVPLADIALGMSRPGVAFDRRARTLWYCCAKPLTALAVGMLWERGLLDPFAPLAEHLTVFARSGEERLSAADIMTHTGPVPTGLDPLHGALFAPDDVHRTLIREMVLPAAGPPRVNYSQWWGWLVLAELIEVVTGRAHDDVVREDVLRPCGIEESTAVRLTPEEFELCGDRLPLIYISAAGRPAQPTWWFSGRASTTCMLPGVNTRGPMADLGRFMEMTLAGGVGASGDRICAPTTIAALTARHRHTLRDEFGNADWGLGFRLECGHIAPEFTSFSRHASPRTYGHEGLWTAVAFADPDADLAVAVHLNGKTQHEQHRERILRIGDAVYKDLGLARC